MEHAITSVFVGVILLVIGATLLLGQASTIHSLTATGTGTALENVSSNAKSLYGLGDFVWAGVSLVFIVIGGFSIAVGVKKMVGA